MVDSISIHALREEGDLNFKWELLDRQISIHALREEGDKGGHCTAVAQLISIHALREEGDALRSAGCWTEY